MVKSSFSGKEIPPGKGIMYVKKDGRVLWFLNRKEEKNMLQLKRKPRTVAWTEEYRKAKSQRIATTKHAKESAEKKSGLLLQDVDGVGEVMAETLKKAGIKSVSALAEADKKTLTKIDGVGAATAKKMQRAAQEALK